MSIAAIFSFLFFLLFLKSNLNLKTLHLIWKCYAAARPFQTNKYRISYVQQNLYTNEYRISYYHQNLKTNTIQHVQQSSRIYKMLQPKLFRSSSHSWKIQQLSHNIVPRCFIWLNRTNLLGNEIQNCIIRLFQAIYKGFFRPAQGILV